MRRLISERILQCYHTIQLHLMTLCSLYILQLVPLMFAPVAAEQQTAAALCSSANNAAMVQSAQAFDTMVFNKELNQGVMEVDRMYGYRHSTVQAQQSLVSAQRNSFHSASFRQKAHNIYEDIALADSYLYGYFSQVGNQIHLIHL